MEPRAQDMHRCFANDRQTNSFVVYYPFSAAQNIKSFNTTHKITKAIFKKNLISHQNTTQTGSHIQIEGNPKRTLCLHICIILFFSLAQGNETCCGSALQLWIVCLIGLSLPSTFAFFCSSFSFLSTSSVLFLIIYTHSYIHTHTHTLSLSLSPAISLSSHPLFCSLILLYIHLPSPSLSICPSHNVDTLSSFFALYSNT